MNKEQLLEWLEEQCSEAMKEQDRCVKTRNQLSGFIAVGEAAAYKEVIEKVKELS